MSKKDGKYIPQFDFDNIKETEHELQTCKKCGKQGKYLGLDKNGLCFDCREESKNKQECNMRLYPDWDKFNEYQRNKRPRDNDGNTCDSAKSNMLFFAFGAFYSFELWIYCLIWSAIVLILLTLMFAASYFFKSTIPAIVIFIIFIISIVAFYLTGESRRRKRFDKYNNMKIEISDDEWICPCCKKSNIGKKHCECCGVLPHFK